MLDRFFLKIPHGEQFQSCRKLINPTNHQVLLAESIGSVAKPDFDVLILSQVVSARAVCLCPPRRHRSDGLGITYSLSRPLLFIETASSSTTLPLHPNHPHFNIKVISPSQHSPTSSHPPPLSTSPLASLSASSISLHIFNIFSLFTFASALFLAVRSSRSARRHLLTSVLMELQFPKSLWMKPWAWHSSRAAIISVQPVGSVSWFFLIGKVRKMGGRRTGVVFGMEMGMHCGE